MSIVKQRAGEVRTTITLKDDPYNFNSQTTTTRLKGNFIVVNAFQNAFAPFRIYAVEISIENGTPPGNYELNGHPDNKVKLVYVPPSTNVLNFFVDESGWFYLSETATLERVIGTFYCDMIRMDNATDEKATLNPGVVSFHQELQPSSTGTLKGTLQPDSESFSATEVSMEFVGGTGPDSFLQIIAKVKDAPQRQLHLHIPRDRLGGHRLPITTNEDGTSALATLIYNGVHRATEGTIDYVYDNDKQRLSGTLAFKADNGITLDNGQFDISGIIPAQ